MAIYAPESYTTTPHTSSDFVRAQGRQLVVGAANAPIRLMGVNFNAYGEEDESADTIFSGNNYDANSYQDVADMGLTVVRLDLWWKLFEDENNPYTYKQAGWDWLNKNINWARDAGVYLILDMHAPHGGFQGPGYSGGFWSNSDQKARTKALWTEIASRYKDEIVIAAYDIFNEPAAPATSQLIAYSQELVDAIRTVDTNHLLIVEIDYGDNNTGAFLVNDPQSNVMYDFHQYAPWYHNAALGYHYGYGDYGLIYPDANGYIQPWDSVVEGYRENSSITTGTTGWTWYEGQLFTAPNTNTWGATPVLISDSNSGTVLFDDFVVNEYDAAGNFVRQIHNIDPDLKPSDWWMLYETHAARAPFVSYTNDWKGLALDSGSSGSKGTSSTAHVGDKSLSLSSTSGKYAIGNTKLNFSVKQGHQYRISGWVKGTNVAGSGANLGLRWLGFKSWDTPRPFTKASLETGFFDNDELQFYIDANVPVNIGEFGTAVANFQDGRGGLAWVSDMLDIMDTYDLNAQYFHYHSAPWGIYYNVFGFPNATHYNADLANLFASRNYRSSLNPTTYTLDVVNGSGDGDYAETAQITITADAAPTGQVFDVWTGDTTALADSTQATTTVTMPAAAVTVTATYRIPAPTLYTLTVNSGNGDGDYIEGTQVSVTADAAPTGQVFDVWTGDTGVLADPTQATTTVTMPAAAATITATYKADTPTLYTLTVNSGSGDGDYAAAAQVSVTADAAPSGQEFDVWTGDTSILADASQATTTVTMPASAATINATYRTGLKSWQRC